MFCCMASRWMRPWPAASFWKWAMHRLQKHWETLKHSHSFYKANVFSASLSTFNTQTRLQCQWLKPVCSSTQDHFIFSLHLKFNEITAFICHQMSKCRFNTILLKLEILSYFLQSWFFTLIQAGRKSWANVRFPWYKTVTYWPQKCLASTWRL